MRLVLVAMIGSILSIVVFKYADHSIGFSIYSDDPRLGIALSAEPEAEVGLQK